MYLEITIFFLYNNSGTYFCVRKAFQNKIQTNLNVFLDKEDSRYILLVITLQLGWTKSIDVGAFDNNYHKYIIRLLK